MGTTKKPYEVGEASWYGDTFHGRPTASGELFNEKALTAAHPTLPFGSCIKVRNEDNGQSVVVRVNDRGPFSGSRVIDLSKRAAKDLGYLDSGTATVSLYVGQSKKTCLGVKGMNETEIDSTDELIAQTLAEYDNSTDTAEAEASWVPAAVGLSALVILAAAIVFTLLRLRRPQTALLDDKFTMVTPPSSGPYSGLDGEPDAPAEPEPKPRKPRAKKKATAKPAKKKVTARKKKAAPTEN